MLWLQSFARINIGNCGRTGLGMESLMGGGGYAGSSPATQYDGKMAYQPTLQQRLDAAVAQAEERLALAKEAREIFGRNPDLERLLNIMQKGVF